LDHEVGDDAVKCQAVVKTIAGELLEVGNSLRRLVVVQLDANIAVLCLNGGGFHGNFVRCVVDRG
jgi:hypothetical protein